jgi:hypothetical protein
MLAGLGPMPVARAQAQAPATQAGPGAAEVEFWRSTERLGTPDAYAAYLADYPSGHYAALARLALSAAGGKSPAPSVPAVPAVPFVSSASSVPSVPSAGAHATTPAAPEPAQPALRHFSAAPASSAIAFRVGDRFSGPGIVTVGRLGSRKQLALPPGEWVVLAALDHDHPVSGQFTTVRFGKFQGRRLQSMLGFTVNRSATSTSRWTDIEQCAGASAGTLVHKASLPSAMRSECVAVHAVGGIRLADRRAGAEALASLERLGASFDGPALTSVWYFAQRQHGYMRASRIDWLHATYGSDSGPAASWQPGALAASPEREAHAQALLRWVEGYRLLAASGFTRALDLEDLQPGRAADPEDRLSLLVDVAWPPRRSVP